MNALAKEPRPKKRSAAHEALRAFGITRPSETPLLVPVGYEDFTAPQRDVDAIQPGETVPLIVEVTTKPTRSSSGPPRHAFLIEDANKQQFRAAIFGDDPHQADAVVPGNALLLLASAKDRGGKRWITCKEVIEPEWMGRVRPVYPMAKSGRLRDQVRHVVQSYLPSMVDKAAEAVAHEFESLADMPTLLSAVGCQGWSLRQLLLELHTPHDVKYAEHARRAYLKLAALGVRERAYRQAMPAVPTVAVSVQLATIESRIAQLPVTLTRDQRAALEDIKSRVAGRMPMRHVLAGETGSGKSYVAMVAAAMFHDAGKRTLIMAPTFPLVAQLYDEFVQRYPDVSCVLVAGNEGVDSGTDGSSASVVIGTSAVLTRHLGEFQLVVVDEQQRWSREQREQYVAAPTHLLEMTATCIPRTQALLRFGHLSMSQLRDTHAAKTISTYLWQGHAGAEQMFEHIRKAITQRQPVFVVYPKKEASGDASPKRRDSGAMIDARHSIEAALPRWEKLFPGRVRALTGDDENEAKQAALADIVQGRAEILLATTVIEVGISLPNLYHIVIVHPDRYGLTSLHQMRGRVARKGGLGFCHLWAPQPLAAKAQERMDAFVATTDGFALAEADLRLRGAGDLAPDSQVQSGADETFLFGTQVGLDELEEVGELWEQLHERGHPARA